MKYKELLEKAKKYDINISKLAIAYEVESVFGEDMEGFEDACSLIYEAWLDSYATDIAGLTLALENLLEEEMSLDDITTDDIVYRYTEVA